MSSTTNSGTASSTQLSPTEIRLQLLANGWTPLPNADKACYLEKWPSVAVTPETLEKWGRRHKRWAATGLRIENGLCVLDFDIPDQELIDACARAAEEAQPVLSRALIRFGSGTKEAWFIRCSEPFGRIATRRWLAPGTVADDGVVACLEAFGGASPRQFGSFGAHTRNPDSSTKIAYAWADEESPLTIPLSDLPELTKAEVTAVVDAVEQVLAASGWEVVTRSKFGESENERVYDLTEDMVFQCNDGVDRTLAELQAVAGEEGLRCSASWLEGPSARRRDRCLIARTHGGAVAVWEANEGVTHLAADRAPTDRTKPEGFEQRVAEALAKLQDTQTSEKKAKRLAKVNDEDDLLQTARKLVAGYALCPTQQLPVVPIWADDITDAMSMTNFRHAYAPHSEAAIGVNGQELKSRVSPVDLWLNSTSRLTVAGLRMRPDKPRPTYEEDGKQWINVYAAPVHTAAPEGGEVFEAFMEHLIPDPAERDYALNAMAHKLRNPAVPGPALLMVSPRQGAGRGTLFAMLRQLYGTKYVRKVDPVTLTGEGGQSQYNTWLASSVMVLVDELFNAGDGAVYWRRKKAYDRIKALIDPSAREVEIIQKTLNNFTAPTYASFIMATNNANALPLDDDDRRIYVVSNGGKLADNAELSEALAVYRRGGEFSEGFIAAIAQALYGRSLSEFDAFAPPPMTMGKLNMIHRNMTEVAEAADAVLEEMPGDFVTRNAYLERVRRKISANGGDHHSHKHLVEEARERIDKSGWFFMGRVKINERENKADVWARSEAHARRWSGVSWSEREALIGVSGDPAKTLSDAQRALLAKGLSTIDGGKAH